MTRHVVVDTNHISFAVRGDVTVRRRILAHQRGGIAMTAITLAELEFSTMCHPRPEPWDTAWRRLTKDWPLLSFHRDEAEEHARIRRELSAHPIGERDMIIAAIARRHGLAVATNNAEFKRVRGLKVEDWTKG